MLAFYTAQIAEDEDQKKFEEIYNAYRPIMLKIADSILHDPNQAEDAVHNSFLYILKILSDIIQPVSPRTKVLAERVVTHIAIDMSRSRRREQKILRPLGEESAQWVPDAEETFAELEKADQGIQIKRYILELPREDQELLRLFYGAKIPAKDLSLLLGVSKRTVYNRLRGIMDRLRERLREEDWLD